MPEASVNVHQAKTHLSRLLERVEGGQEVVIARAGRPVARLVPYVRRSEPRPLGVWRGRIRVGPEFDEADDEISRLFEG